MKHKFYKFLVSLVSMENSMKVKNESKEILGEELLENINIGIKNFDSGKFKIRILD